jgi:hypothetical protein
MMSRVKMMLAATFLGGAVMAGSGALAQMPMGHPMGGPMGPGVHGPMHGGQGFNASDYDPAQLPEFKGKVSQYTLSPRGDVNGVLLADGATVRMPPHAVRKLGDLLKPGNTVFVRGFGAASPLGTSIGAQEIGPSADKLTRVEMSHAEHGHDGMMRLHDMIHGAPDGAAAPAPAAPK